MDLSIVLTSSNIATTSAAAQEVQFEIVPSSSSTQLPEQGQDLPPTIQFVQTVSVLVRRWITADYFIGSLSDLERQHCCSSSSHNKKKQRRD